MAKEKQQRSRLSRWAVALVWVWVVLLVLVAATALTLQILGPLPPPSAAHASPAGKGVAFAGAQAIPGPLPALEQPFGNTNLTLPRIGADGRMPMQAYAAPFNAADPRPRVAVLLTGLGLAQADSERAIDTLPAAISLAFSPYAVAPEALQAAARGKGHELLISLPMEPEGFPANDAGNEALLTGASWAENEVRLHWALAACHACVGVTAAMGSLMGGRFAASPQMPLVRAELAARGLLYIAPPAPAADDAPRSAPGLRTADLILDRSSASEAIARELAALEQIAHDRGTALGIAGPPNPVTVGQLAAWAQGLGARGLVLVPVSALVPALALPTTGSKPR